MNELTNTDKSNLITTVKNLATELSNVEGVNASTAFPIRVRKYKEGYRIYVKYIFDTARYKNNLQFVVDNGHTEYDVLHDYGKSVEQVMRKVFEKIRSRYPDLDVKVTHNTWGMYGSSVWDEVVLTVTDKLISESYDYQEHDIYIPAPYDKYYEIAKLNDGSIAEEDIPDAFDYYEMKLLAVVYAKEQYEDALANNCLDYCYLIEDNGEFALVTTAGLRVHNVEIAEVERCINKPVEEDFDTREPSSVEYGEFMTNHYREVNQLLQKYNITKTTYRRSTQYTGVVNGHKFFFVEGNTGTGHYAKELYIDNKEVNLYQSKDSARALSNLNTMNYFGIQSLIKMLEQDYLDRIVYQDDLDDYEESLIEDVEMTDAQRLALQELDTCLEVGELDSEKHALAYQIQWDINFEDVLLFINGVTIDLKDIKHVEYGDCDETKFDGCYDVTLHNGDVKKYGWHDFDMTGSLTCIDCNEGAEDNELTEDVNDGWEKPFDWTEMYRKDGFTITGNHEYPTPTSWHLEQTRPRSKHIGNYRTLADAKAAGDKEIAARNGANKDKEPQWGVHQFSTDSIIFRGTEEECANYINDNELWNDAEVYMIKPDDRHYIHENTSMKKFQSGDHVYVTVANRGGRVLRMISDDVVEVELDETFLYPARIDRYYIEEVELIATEDDLDDNDDIEGLEPVVIEHPEDIDTYLSDPDSKFIPDDDF